MAEDVRLAAEVRETVINGLDTQAEQAVVDRDEAIVKAEADRDAGIEAHNAARVAVEEEIEEEKRADERNRDAVTDEIKEIAERGIAINAQIQEHL